MSRYFSDQYKTLTPYTPGEQPRDQQYIKLNTNESPFPPSPKAQALAAEELKKLQLYSDPTCASLTAAAAKALGVGEETIIRISPVEGSMATAAPTLPAISSSPRRCRRASIVLVR